MQGCAAKTGVLACAVLMLAATASRCETAKPDAADSAAVQSCIKSAADGSQRERCIGIIADPCADRPDAQSTADQVACAAREFAVWDDILNETYRRLRVKLDAEQKVKLRAMQRAWIDFPRAQLRVLLGFFPRHHGLAHERVLQQPRDRAPGVVSAGLSRQRRRQVRSHEIRRRNSSSRKQGNGQPGRRSPWRPHPGDRSRHLEPART